MLPSKGDVAMSLFPSRIAAAVGLAMLLVPAAAGAAAVSTAAGADPDAPPVSRACPETPRSPALPPDPTAASGATLWFVNAAHGLWAAADYRYTVGETKVLWGKPPGTALTVTGRRLDAAAPPLTASVPDGYPGGFQASGLSFSDIGCWEVDAAAGDQHLSFVVRVYPLGSEAPNEGCRDLADAVAHAGAIATATVADDGSPSEAQSVLAQVRVGQVWRGALPTTQLVAVRQSTEFPNAVLQANRSYLLFLVPAPESSPAAWDVLCPWYTLASVVGDQIRAAPTLGGKPFWPATALEDLKRDILRWASS
jgi:hypothetical protein